MNLTLFALAVMTILAAIWFVVASFEQKNKRIAKLETSLAESESQVWAWYDYAQYLQSLCNSKDVDLYFARANYEVSRAPIAYSLPVGTTDKGETIYDEKIQAMTLPLMPVANHGSKITTDNDGRFIFTLPEPIVEPIEDTSSKPTNGNKASTKAKDSKASNNDNPVNNGGFSAVEPDYDALAKKYGKNKKYTDFVGKVKGATKVSKLTTNQTNYLLSKFDQWENKPNTVEEYAKRVTVDHMNKNK